MLSLGHQESPILDTDHTPRRVLFINLSEAAVLEQCKAKDVGVSAIEALASGGVRMVCKSVDGSETARKIFKSKMLKGEITRTRHRPTRPLW